MPASACDLLYLCSFVEEAVQLILHRLIFNFDVETFHTSLSRQTRCPKEPVKHSLLQTVAVANICFALLSLVSHEQNVLISRVIKKFGFSYVDTLFGRKEFPVLEFFCFFYCYFPILGHAALHLTVTS